MSAPNQHDFDLQSARGDKARKSPVPSPSDSSVGGSGSFVYARESIDGRDPSTSPTYAYTDSNSRFPYPSPPPAEVSRNSAEASSTFGIYKSSPEHAQQRSEASMIPNVAMRNMVPVNVMRNSATGNSELRQRASPIGRPVQPQHGFPSPMVGAYGSQAAALRSGMYANTPHDREMGVGGRRLSGSGVGPVGSALLGTSRRAGLLVPILCFLGGMILMYIVLSSAMLPSAIDYLPADLRTHSMSSSTQQQQQAGVGDAVSMRALMSRKSAAQVEADYRAALPLCGASDYGDGEWVYDGSISKPAYVSHEWDNVCDADGQTDAAGQPIPKPAIRPELQWVWQPRHCRLLSYTRDRFCELLAGRNILFAGDSIAGQHLSSFVHLMHHDPDHLWIRDEYFRHDVMTVCQDMYPVKKEGDANAAAPAADGSAVAPVAASPAGVDQYSGAPLPGVRVGFKRNNFLSLHRSVNRSVEFRKWNTNQAWINEVGSATATADGVPGPKYDIIVINTGIWMVDAPVYADMLRGIAEALQAEYPHVTMLWRSTQPGHAHCHTHWARPQKTLYGIADTTGGSARFRWEEAEERNRIAQAQFPTQFFDVWNLTRLRPDGHMPGECLHYCQPGPVDEWHKLLYHRLAIMNPTFVRKVEAQEAALAQIAAAVAAAEAGQYVPAVEVAEQPPASAPAPAADSPAPAASPNPAPTPAAPAPETAAPVPPPAGSELPPPTPALPEPANTERPSQQQQQAPVAPAGQ